MITLDPSELGALVAAIRAAVKGAVEEALEAHEGTCPFRARVIDLADRLKRLEEVNDD